MQRTIEQFIFFSSFPQQTPVHARVTKPPTDKFPLFQTLETYSHEGNWNVANLQKEFTPLNVLKLGSR